MEQHRTAPPPPARSAASASSSPCRNRWTPAKQRIFLAALLETGSVTRAARAAGMDRTSAQRLRRRLAGTPFDRTWDQVLASHAASLANPFGTETAPMPSGRRNPAANPPQR